RRESSRRSRSTAWIPGPFDELGILARGDAVDAAGGIARALHLPPVIGECVAGAALDRAVDGDGELLIEADLIGIEREDEIGEHPDIEPGAAVALRQALVLRQDLLVLLDAPAPALALVEGSEGARGAVDMRIVDIAMAVEVLQ